ncbi:alpha/beta hydrolase-fold protein [Mycobacterium sp. IS-836]|uniref:alpha/beta hydrolase-fold protein n=1 Tax=Mycobacterium sp. IS-836 TaxID=1834160 RepID=UPI001E5D6938|nr:alpha/beta hydrolase-fold protein [Mycobacterium sp. IS-836]
MVMKPPARWISRRLPVSLFDVAQLPVRSVGRLLGAAPNQAQVEPPPGAPLVVVDGMPEGAPPAARRPEPQLPSPVGWPFGEHFPRTCGTGRLAAGASFWTDFLYDDHGATGTRVRLPAAGRIVPPKGTYLYPDGAAGRNGADIFRVAVGLTETHTWWRVDWNTLQDPSVPIALFAFDTGRDPGGTGQWPAGAGVRSAGIDSALLISGAGAWLIDLVTRTTTAVGHSVDGNARSFLAQIPRELVEPAGKWTVRLVSGLANPAGDGFAEVPPERGARPRQPNVYNIAFRRHEQEPQRYNFWLDKAQAEALDDGDVSQFSLAVAWDELAAGTTTDEPVVTGPSTRWYVSSVELGQGIADADLLSTEPQFLGRVQPYSICLPKTFAPGKALPLTLLLHSIAMGKNQFAAVNPRLVQQICDGRDSVVATPLGRGPACWFLDEGELDLWEVWARVAEQLGTDPNRTVIAGFSMGGYAAYRLALTYPTAFAQAVVLAGAPTCGVRLLPGIKMAADRNPDSHCAREGETWPLLHNARWLPFVIAHGVLDELVPIFSVVPQVLRLDRLGYRYRFVAYLAEDHIVLAAQGKFDDAVAHMGTANRHPDPGHITFSWYPQLVRTDLGIGPHRVWWISGLQADPQTASKRGAVATVDARSYARPDRTRSTHRRGGLILNFKPTPGFYAERTWRLGPHPRPQPRLTLRLTGVAALTVDAGRAGVAALPYSTVTVITDCPVQLTLDKLAPGTVARIDGAFTDTTVAVPQGRHRITLAAGGALGRGRLEPR